MRSLLIRRVLAHLTDCALLFVVLVLVLRYGVLAGRIAMTRESLSTTMEEFAIRVDNTDEGGTLRLLWDQTAFVVPFTVL